MRVFLLLLFTINYCTDEGRSEIRFVTDDAPQLFSLVRRIQLSSDVLVGQISNLDVDENGNLLVTDYIGRSVLLYGFDGRLKKKLSADSCNPGFHFAPLKAKFSSKSWIVMTNSAPWGFRFKRNGECFAPMDKTFIAPMDFCFDRKENIYGYFIGGTGGYLSRMDSTGKEILRYRSFPNQFKNLLSRMEGGGIVCDDSGFIYVALPTGPEVYKYSPRGELMAKFGVIPSYYNRIEQDISSSTNPQTVLADFRRVTMGKNTTLSIHLIEKDKIVLQYLLAKTIGIEVYDVNGKRLLRSVVQFDMPFVTFKNGYGYRVIEPEPDAHGNLANPQIEVFKYIGAQMPKKGPQ